MYRVHLDNGANQGEVPGIGESPSNQPISGLVIFSKRQALSRAVVVNSNMSRGKYLAREGPGSRLKRMDTIGKGPAILSTCVKRWRFFACKVGFLLQDRTKFGTAGLFRQKEHAKAVIRTVLYTLTTATNFNAAA